jgi:hypothetical protein
MSRLNNIDGDHDDREGVQALIGDLVAKGDTDERRGADRPRPNPAIARVRLPRANCKKDQQGADVSIGISFFSTARRFGVAA